MASQHSQACRKGIQCGSLHAFSWVRAGNWLQAQFIFAPPLLFTFLQACECWEAKRFLPTVLGAQRQGTTKEIGAGCLGDPDIILTLVHTTSKPWCTLGFNDNSYLPAGRGLPMCPEWPSHQTVQGYQHSKRCFKTRNSLPHTIAVLVSPCINLVSPTSPASHCTPCEMPTP